MRGNAIAGDCGTGWGCRTVGEADGVHSDAGRVCSAATAAADDDGVCFAAGHGIELCHQALNQKTPKVYWC